MLEFKDVKVCENCRFWSDMVAKFEKGKLVAVCLSQSSQYMGDYTEELHRCDSWEFGSDGAVDERGKDPMRYEDGLVDHKRASL